MKLIMENFRRFLLAEDIQGDINNFLKELDALPGPAEKIDYTEAKLGYLGKGSSRVAYVLEDRVLKIAINKAGVAQNKVEANVHTQETLKPWAAKVFDRDSDFHWILQEKVDASNDNTERAWKATLGGIPDDIVDALHHYGKALDRGYNFEQAWAEAQTFGFWEDGLKPIAQDLISKLHRLGLADIGPGNTGVAPDGRPVILDAGFDESVAKIYGWIGDEGMFLPFPKKEEQEEEPQGTPFTDMKGNAFGVGEKIEWWRGRNYHPAILTVIGVKDLGDHQLYAIIGMPDKELSQFLVSPEDIKKYVKVAN